MHISFTDQEQLLKNILEI